MTPSFAHLAIQPTLMKFSQRLLICVFWKNLRNHRARWESYSSPSTRAFWRNQRRITRYDLRRSIADSTRAIELDPNNASAYYDRSTAKAGLAKLGDSEDLDDAKAYRYNLDYTKSRKGDWNGAIADCNRAIELDPNYALNRGSTKRFKGDLEGAIADFTHLIELDPNNAYTYDNRGRAKHELGDWQGAIADFTHLIELKPNYTKAYDNRGDAKRAKGDWQGAIADYTHAIADYTRAIEFNPNNAYTSYTYDLRSLARLKKGDLKGAIADFIRAFKINREIESQPLK